MADVVKIQFEGIQEFNDLLNEIRNDFDEKDSKKILNAAVRLAMKPVLDKAKMLVPVDTGALRASLRLEVRKPTRKDKRSKYVNDSDIVIGTVTTAPGSVLAKKKFINVKTNKKQTGIPSDARAIANEFGTATMAGKPYMRPALESSGQESLNSLSISLKTALEKYRSKYNKR